MFESSGHVLEQKIKLSTNFARIENLNAQSIHCPPRRTIDESTRSNSFPPKQRRELGLRLGRERATMLIGDLIYPARNRS